MKVYEKANKMVSDLCHGTKDWIMTIPVDEENDPDVVIGKAIRAGMDAEATAARLRELLRRGLEPLNSAEYRIWVEDVKKELADD